MPEYKLTYFDLRALGEPIRWVFKLAKVPFEDVRIPYENWDNVKDQLDLPLGQMPTLEEDGKKLTQSVAIGQYLSRKFGFYTEDIFLNYRSEQVIAICEDCRLGVVRPIAMEIIGNGDSEKTAEMRKNIKTQMIPKYLNQLESIVGETDGAFVAGEQVTFGDIFTANWLQIWEDVLSSNLLENYPNLRKLKEAVTNLLEIKEWIAVRPKSFV